MNNRYANPFTRPQTFGVQPQFSAAPNPYAMSQQWPAATSTELWTHQQQMAQYQSRPPAANNNQMWAPALPVTNNSAAAMQMLPTTPSWNPNLDQINKK